VDVVQGELQDVTKILNSDQLFQIGLATKTMNHVLRIHKLDGAINAGVIKGTTKSDYKN
jgi:hypothetical protein